MYVASTLSELSQVMGVFIILEFLGADVNFLAAECVLV